MSDPKDLTIEQYNVKQTMVEFDDYLSSKDTKSFIMATEWKNGDGYDIYIESSDSKHFSLTRDEFKALVVAINGAEL